MHGCLSDMYWPLSLHNSDGLRLLSSRHIVSTLLFILLSNCMLRPVSWLLARCHHDGQFSWPCNGHFACIYEWHL